jgi:hypothetical protein
MEEEFLSLAEIAERAEGIRAALDALLLHRSLVGKPSSEQWRFFASCGEKLLLPDRATEFDGLDPSRAARLKFEVEDRLRRFFRRPENSRGYVFTLVHGEKLPGGLVTFPPYPNVAGYCLLVQETAPVRVSVAIRREELRSFVERAISDGVEAEFRAYAALPGVRKEEIDRRFFRDGPAHREIVNLLIRHKARGWVISNSSNPSTMELMDVIVHRVDVEDAVAYTTEYWDLSWWDENRNAYACRYRGTSRQIYTLRRDEREWKVFRNVRSVPRSNALHARTKTR